MSLVLSFFILLGGLVLLFWSADKFVASAVAIAKQMNVSKLLIGLTVVSVGTSAPEIVVTLAASLQGNSGLAFGNAIGSNIANVGLVLGVTAIVVPLPFATSVLKFEMPWLLLATLVVAVILTWDYELSRIDGVILYILLSAGMYQMFRAARKRHELPTGLEDELEDIEEMSKRQAWSWLLIGLVLLAVAAELVVFGAKDIARYFGVPNSVVGVTIVALGTSLPELAATLTAATRGHPEIAIGNVVGSNILNILAVLPIPALILPYALSTVEIWRDLGAMFAFTMLLALFAYGIRSRKIVTRFEGCVLLLGYVGFMVVVAVQEFNKI
ncbi:MAG: calcium/sodium antiporter [Gammaproteobacteria bacterium]|nr:calcium/sodium antiporter [Gammaproteobacteria bacterium]